MSDQETNTDENQGVKRFIGGYIYDGSDDPPWGYIEDVNHEGDDLTFFTSPINGNAVPDKVRAQVLEEYTDGVTIVEVEA